MWITILILLIGALTVCYAWVMKRMSLFKNANVPEDPGYFPMGSTTSFKVIKQQLSFVMQSDELYWKFRDKAFVGYYGFLGGGPTLVINDLEIAKRIMIKDFDHFVDRRSLDLAEEPNKYLKSMLTSMTGDKWKAMRSTISPVFTSGKLKGIVPRIDKVSDSYLLFSMFYEK